MPEGAGLDFNTMSLLRKSTYSVQYKELEDHNIDTRYSVFTSDCIGGHYKSCFMGHTTYTEESLAGH